MKIEYAQNEEGVDKRNPNACKRNEQCKLLARQTGTKKRPVRFRRHSSCTIVNLHESIVEAAEYSTVNVHVKSAVCDYRFWPA
jgi:hypothetical protein